jgi:hypothetical protein
VREDEGHESYLYGIYYAWAWAERISLSGQEARGRSEFERCFPCSFSPGVTKVNGVEWRVHIHIHRNCRYLQKI